MADQTAAPIADTSLGNWTPTPDDGVGYTKIDEATPDDSDYVTSPANASSEVYSVQLASITDPEVSSGHKVSYRIQKGTSGGQQVNLTVELVEDLGGAGEAVRATWSHTDIANGWTTHEQTLSTAEADSITDYANLYLRFTANAP